ncbi:MAG TPA: hypothetical protein VFP61_16395 [Acidimicrobiales bacterium]|nr:hypothetical protein [Acidimicrobiales bacterium]
MVATLAPPAPAAAAAPEVAPGGAGPSAGRSRAARFGAAVVTVERLVVSLLATAGALVGGWVLDVRYHTIQDDGLSRLANAYYVLHSRDHHLAAIGFVWNPLPSLLDLPITLFSGVAHTVLISDAYGAAIVSAAAFGVATWQLHGFLAELGARGPWRLGLLACFCLHPLVAIYAANGMSEMLLIACLLATARHLARWSATDRTGSLVAAGLAVGLAYLARPEGALAAAGATAAVAVVSFGRGRRTGFRLARQRALADSVVFVAPFVLALVVWLATSWIITGHPLEYVSSSDGNSVQVKEAGAVIGATVSARLGWSLFDITFVAPLLLIAVGLAAVRASFWRDGCPVVVAGVLGSVLGGEVVLYAAGDTFHWLRFYVYAVPLTVMLAAAALLAERSVPAARTGSRAERAVRAVARSGRRAVLGALAVAVAAPGIATTASALADPAQPHTKDERFYIAPVFQPSSVDGRAAAPAQKWAQMRDLAARLDAMHLGDGALAVDDAVQCVPYVILDSAHPTQFRIPNDEDFVHSFGALYPRGVRYLLVSDPSAVGVPDAIDQRLPGVYANGAGVATLVHTFTYSQCPTFRLYRVLPSATGPVDGSF